MRSLSFAPKLSASVLPLALLASASSAPFAQGSRVNAPVVPGGSVGNWKIAADGSRVFYDGVQTTPGMREVHDVPLDGSQATRILSTPLLPGRSCSLFPFQVSPDENHLLYLADQDTDEKVELYSVPTDGSRVSTKLNGPLIAQGDVQVDMRWTPDGSRVLFRADAVQDSFFYLYSVVADGSQAPVQLHPQGVFSFGVTLDSSRAIFLSNQLYTVPVDGSAPSQRLSNAPHTDQVTDFALTADGQSVVFGGGYFYYDPISEEETAHGLYAAPVDGSAPARVLVPPIEASFSNSVPPHFEVTSDSKYAAFHSRVTGELYTVRVDGLAPPVLVNPPGTEVSEFALSPDGRTLVLTAVTGNAVILYSAPVDGSEAPKALTSAPDIQAARKCAISARGRAVFIGFHAGVWELYSVPLDGHQPPTKLSAPMVAGGGMWDPNTAGTPSFWISPGGSWVIYKADQDVDEQFELYCAPIHGRRAPHKVIGTLVAGGDVSLASFVPGAQRIVYNADQETDNSYELFESAYGDLDFPAPSLGTKGTRAAGSPTAVTVTLP